MKRALLLLAGMGLWLGCQSSPADRIQKAHDAILDRKPSAALRQYRLALDAVEHDDSPSSSVFRAKALRGMGDVYYLELHDIRQAATTYKELITQCPEAAETMEARVMLSEILRVYFHDYRGAIAQLEAALTRNPPQSAELLYEVAKLYFAVGDYQQAQLEAQKLVQRYETSPFVDDALFLIAQALGMQEGMHQEAARAYQALIDRFPNSELTPHALFELGKLKADAGENDTAIAIWVQALKSHPDPKVVQGAIARVRRRITQTTPSGMGQHAAFERPNKNAPLRVNHRTSVEAVGGTAEEAKHDFGD